MQTQNTNVKNYSVNERTKKTSDVLFYFTNQISPRVTVGLHQIAKDSEKARTFQV